MVTGFTLAGLCLYRRDLALIRALRPLRGGALLLALVLPWFIAITLKSEGGFWAASVSRDLIAKLGEGQESHGAPPGSYLAALWLTFWPGSMLLLPALPRIWAARRQPVTLFMAAWVVPVWIIFELTSTKLLHYVLPTYPALAILTALALPQAGRWRWSALLPAMVAPALLIGLTLAAQSYDLTLPATVWPLGAALILSTLALLWLILRLPQATGLLTLSLAAAGLSAALVIYPTLAFMTPLWPARSLAALADDHPGCQLTVAGYGEPSLIFLTQRRVALAPPEAIAAALAAPGCQIVALPVTAPQPSGQSLGTLSALNLGSGKRIQLALYIKAE
jgi:4-amino-4-deoxy-L-arabinose transferase-like glycosyltransferase